MISHEPIKLTKAELDAFRRNPSSEDRTKESLQGELSARIRLDRKVLRARGYADEDVTWREGYWRRKYQRLIDQAESESTQRAAREMNVSAALMENNWLGLKILIATRSAPQSLEQLANEMGSIDAITEELCDLGLLARDYENNSVVCTANGLQTINTIEINTDIEF